MIVRITAPAGFRCFLGPMTTKPIDVNEQQVRLDWMRAEFRTAQQRRSDTRRPRVTDVSVAKSTPPAEVEPPSLGTPSR